MNKGFYFVIFLRADFIEISYTMLLIVFFVLYKVEKKELVER